MIARTIGGLGLLLSALGAHAAEKSPALATPMINPGIYRDGEVQRLKGRFGDWTVTCDEIKSLKQRYCSLRSVALRNDNRGAAVVDLSTGDNGKPAALVHLPLGVSVAYGLDVEVGEASASRPKPTGRNGAGASPGALRKLGIVSCSDRECLAVWSLNADDVRALTDGTAIRLTACSPDPDRKIAAADAFDGTCEFKSAGTLSASGFKEAIHAATL